MSDRIEQTDEQKRADPNRVYGRSPGAVLWTIQNCYNIITVIIIGAVCIQIKFVLVPVCMAYFVTFLMAPILDLFEERPFVFGSKVTDATIDLPEDKQEHDDKVVCDNMFHSTRMALPREARGGGSCKGTGVDLMLMGKLPHGLAILMTMVVWFMMMYGVMILISSSVNSFMADEAAKEEMGHEPMATKLNNMGNDFINSLEENGVRVLREKKCRFPNASTFSVMAKEKELAPRYSSTMNRKVKTKDADLVASVLLYNLWEYEATPWDPTEQLFLDCMSNETTITKCTAALLITSPGDDTKLANSKCSMERTATCKRVWCSRLNIFGEASDGTPWEDIAGWVSIVGNLVSDMVLILLLALYVLLERPEGATFGGNNVMEEIEDMIKNYIILKAGISLLTGILVGVCLVVCQVKLGVIFGLLAFLLNFIPNIGSVISCVLPLPVLLLDDELGDAQIWAALLLPTMVQLYVGNALEPKLFGEALNLTAISVLLALVVFGALWQISGAVLSVPLLGVMKIVAHHTDHPQMKSFLGMIREDPDVDDQKDRFWANKRRFRAAREIRDAVTLEEAEKSAGTWVEPEPEESDDSKE